MESVEAAALKNGCRLEAPLPPPRLPFKTPLHLRSQDPRLRTLAPSRCACRPYPGTAALMASDLPCDAAGACMMCQSASPEAEVVLYRTCSTLWHVQCLSKPPEKHASVTEWECPDCSSTEDLSAAAVAASGGSSVPSGASVDLIASIRAIEADRLLTKQEKAKRWQELVSGDAAQDAEEDGDKKRKGKAESDDVLDLLDEKFNCSFCMQLPDRSVTRGNMASQRKHLGGLIGIWGWYT